MHESPTHGILKRDPQPKGAPPGAVVWDEKTIAEHDLERGTRQPIDEPKTPYVGPQDSPPIMDEFSLDQPASPPAPISLVPVSNQLSQPLSQPPPPAIPTPSVDQSQYMQQFAAALRLEADEQRKKREFEQRRKAHYNEFLTVKAHATDSDDEDNEANPQDDK